MPSRSRGTSVYTARERKHLNYVKQQEERRDDNSTQPSQQCVPVLPLWPASPAAAALVHRQLARSSLALSNLHPVNTRIPQPALTHNPASSADLLEVKGRRQQQLQHEVMLAVNNRRTLAGHANSSDWRWLTCSRQTDSFLSSRPIGVQGHSQAGELQY